MTTALVIGGGVAGATTALALQQAGISAVVYESYADGADDIGAFLTVMHNGMDALAAVGLHDRVAAASFPAEYVELVSGTGKQLGHQPIGSARHDLLTSRTLTRSALYQVLHSELRTRGVHIEHGRRVVEYTTERDGRVCARFADGTQATGDLLIGADGLHSTTRALVNPSTARPRYTGLNVVYGYAPQAPEPAPPHTYRMISGTRAFFGYTTAPDDTTFWFARLPGQELSAANEPSMSPQQWKRTAGELFREDNTPAAAIIEATGTQVLGRSAYDVPHIPHWWTPTTVLVGDAAHAASPAAGQGASMALEDSVVLAKCLRDLPDVPSAFAAYERHRRRRVERLVASSATQGATQAPVRFKRTLRDLLSPLVLKRRPESRRWLYEHHIDWNSTVDKQA